MVPGLVEKLTKAYADVFSGIDPVLIGVGNKRVYNEYSA
jgi:hypothetical protein